MRKPIVGIPSCVREVEHRPFHGVGERYINAAMVAMNATPIIIPALGKNEAVADYVQQYLDLVDGLFITGSFSMVAPDRYGEELACKEFLLDYKRDATTIPLLLAAIERGIPLLCICRGIQELNVALGGTLYQNINDLSAEENLNHFDKGIDAPQNIRFGPAHPVELVEGGYLASISPLGRAFWVNSLHTQAIRTLGTGLAVEAISPDGVIEAVRATNATNFAVGIQWHPEWKVEEHPFSRALFNAFAEAMNSPASYGYVI